jgi:hypothetical protein
MIRIALKTVLLSILFLLFYSSLLNGQVVSKIFSADKICQADQQFSFIYPNPSDTYINLTTDFTLGPVNLEIFDIQGRKVMEVVLIGSKKIPVSSLKNGLYVYKMYQMGRVSLGKFIVGKQ